MYFYQDLSPKNKKYARFLGVILLTGLILSAFTFAFSSALSVWRERDEKNIIRQISVNGEGKKMIKPDIALFNAGVVSDAKKIGDAQADNSKHSGAVTDFLKGKGVDEKDIKTVGYSIYPQYQYFSNPPCYTAPCPPQKPPEIVSYQVRHTLEIKVRDLKKLDELLSGVVNKGANEIGSVSFTVDDPDAAKEEARREAIKSARKKAKILAGDLGIKLKKIISFYESAGEMPPIYGKAAYGMGGGLETASPQVQPGEQEVKSFVTITYEIK